MWRILIAVLLAGAWSAYRLLPQTGASPEGLESGWVDPPAEARPHVYWLWLNGYVNTGAAKEELRAMKDAGFSGVLLFDMGARGQAGAQPPAGPAFLSPPWMAQFKELVGEARRLGLQVDFSVVSSWDMGGPWVEPHHASMGLFTTETSVGGGFSLNVMLPFPEVPAAAPKGPDGRPAYWRDAAVLAVPSNQRAHGHEFVFRLDLSGAGELTHAVLDQGSPGSAPPSASMSPVRAFSLSVSSTGTADNDFREVLRGELGRAEGPQRFNLPPGTNGQYARLRLLSAHEPERRHWTLGEFSLLDAKGINVAGSHAADRERSGAEIVRASAPLGYGSQWNLQNLHDGETAGPRGVFATAGPPPFTLASAAEALNVTDHVDREGRLRWDAPPGEWTILRYVVMNTGERLKVPSPDSDGWATDHLNSSATKAHMDYVIGRLSETLGNLRQSGLKNLYLASYEVVGQIWSPGFLADFRRLRGYEMTPYLPAIFGSVIGGHDETDRFLFDYRKTLGEVLVSAYYQAARESANSAGLGIKSEAGGPGPPIHNVPVDSLLANAAVDEIQGEFWPFRPDAHALWVVKETASAGHLYGKPIVHMEAFTSTHHWYEGPQDLKDSADRVFCEGGNHMVWHTWTHAPPEAGLPGWVYLAGSHVNRNVTWWPKIKPFVDYLARSSFLLQRGNFVGDVLYYYGDGGYKFVPPRAPQPGLGAGYDYDFINSDAILNRLAVREGRFVLPGGTNYTLLVLPDHGETNPAVLEKIETLVKAGGTVIGRKPERAPGLEGQPRSDARVREAASRMWGDLDGKTKHTRAYGKGRVVWGRSPGEVLAGMGLRPDFTAADYMDFIHRRDGETEIYFVRNRAKKAVQGKAVFRVKGKQPELWNPVTGERHSPLAWRQTSGGTEVDLALAEYGSIFVVFRRPATTPGAVTPTEAKNDPLPVPGPWTVDFTGGPAAAVFPQLISWTAHSDPGIRFFSGTARYRTAFDVPAGWRRPGAQLELDLGRLWTIGEAWLNGQPLGIVWTAPFTLEATSALRDGRNELVVEVTNTWHNRLAGDARLPAPQRRTRTNAEVSGGKKWIEWEPLDSGLFGPVRMTVKGAR